MYHHQMYKGRILALEPSDSLDAVLELAVQSLVQVVVIIELLLQVNVPDMGKPKALPAPETPLWQPRKTPAVRQLPIPRWILLPEFLQL